VRKFISRLRIFKRLREAEQLAAEAYRALAGLKACVDCGAVQVLGHPKVGTVPVEGGLLQVRCQFHQDVFDRSPKGKQRIIVPGQAPLAERTALRIVKG